MVAKLNLTITKGKTFNKVIRWEKEPLLSKAIASIERSTPARIVTESAHGLTDGWRVVVASAGGMSDINTHNFPPKDRDFRRATVIDATTVELNTVNSAEYPAYTSGGSLVFWTPVSLSGCTARMSVKARVDGDVLLSLTTGNSRITLNDSAKTITLEIDAEDCADLGFSKGIYDLEIEDADGFVTGIFRGSITVETEVTT